MALKLTMTCGRYDRNQALIDGRIVPEGIALDVHVDCDDVRRQMQIQEGRFDAGEFFAGHHIVDLPYKVLGVTAIPIFVKRMFRHSYIYINKRKGIASPADLKGKRVGIQTWISTTVLWVQGMLEDEYGVDPRSITWVTEREDQIGDWQPPPWARLETVPRGATVHSLLSSGAIDAAITTGTWAPDEHPDIDFLFPNYAALERDYFKRTGFFPIMHTLVVKTSVLDEHPWVARSLFDAWQRSKEECYRWLEWQRVHQTSLWYRALWEEEKAAAGPDIYRWGFRDTRAEVDKMLEYAHRLGLTPRKFEPEDMFHPDTLDT
jgi:4,5-dihydroxyphthalate decarboxylase